MKNKKIIISLIIGIVILLLIIVSIKFPHKSYTVKQNGAYFAINKVSNGTTTRLTSFPSRGDYHVDVTCENANGQWLAEEWKLAISDVTGTVTCNLTFTELTSSNIGNYLLTGIGSNTGTSGTGSIVFEGYQYTDAKGNDLDVGYRYEGTNPNNWIWFNNEKWRIIGVVPTETSDGVEWLTKIIRNDSIGSLSYDAKTSGYTGVWGSNTLYTLLNTYYYGKGNATGLTMCESHKCDYTNIGISSSSDDYYNQMIENVYWNTGAASYSETSLSIFQSEISTQSVQNNIGLMSGSDYMFAYGIDSTGDLATRTLINWLYKNNYEWTSIASSSNSNNALVVYNGTVSSTNADITAYIRPVLYLKSSIYNVFGDGSENNPYMIGMYDSSYVNPPINKSKIYDLNVSGMNVTAKLSSSVGLSGYAVSSSNTTAPTNWTSISGTSYDLSYTSSSEGTYYLWVKDSSNTLYVSESFTFSNVQSKTVSITWVRTGASYSFYVDDVQYTSKPTSVEVLSSIKFTCSGEGYLKSNGTSLCSSSSCRNFTVLADDIPDDAVLTINCVCLTPDTIVYYYDPKKKKLKKKKIKDVKYDDLLLCWDFDKGCFAFAKPLWIKKCEYTECYNLLKFEDGNTLKTINQHRIFNKEAGKFTYPMTDDTPLGTTTFTASGTYTKLISKEVINKRTAYYNVITNYHMNLFTGNILTSCRFSNLYDIKDMKYIKDDRKLHDIIIFKDIPNEYIEGLRLREQKLDIGNDGIIKHDSIKAFVDSLEKNKKEK